MTDIHTLVYDHFRNNPSLKSLELSRSQCARIFAIIAESTNSDKAEMIKNYADTFISNGEIQP